jgi:hypothetical protein
MQRRPIQIGDNNDSFAIVTAGLKEGDQVVLNPASFASEEEDDPLKKYQDKQDEETKTQETDPADDTSSGTS